MKVTFRCFLAKWAIDNEVIVMECCRHLVGRNCALG
jgi:hypothetical protein